MRRILCLVSLLFVFSFLAAPTPASAVPIIEATMEDLDNASPAEIEKWLESNLKEDLYFIDGFEFDNIDEKSLTNFEPGFDWVYAVVKYGVNFKFIAFEYDGGPFGPDLLDFIDKDISNVTFYAPVPEPATMLLFGCGLIGLAAVGRKKFKQGNIK